MSEWPEYETRKRVRAATIVSFNSPDPANRLRAFVDPGTGVHETFAPTEAGMLARVEPGDKALRYPDGFRSVNTKANFEATAVLVDEKPTHLWCAVRTHDASVNGDTLKVTVNTSIRAFTTQRAARDWIAAQSDEWSIVITALDPPVEAA